MTDLQDDVSAPLQGNRVLDFTKIVAGPKATMILADLGAEVIKVEGPGQEDPSRLSGKITGVTFAMANGNKKSVMVDLSQPEGRNLARRLALTCDVVVEANRPGVMDWLGLGYSDLAKQAPSLIYASLSGYGPIGPDAKKGGIDTIIQAESGLMYNTGEADGPPTMLGGYIIDETAGLALSQSIDLALYIREKSGRGSHVEVSLLDTAVYLQSYEIALSSISGHQPARNGNKLGNTAPGGIVTAHDRPMILVSLNDQSYKRLCQVIEQPDLAVDERYSTRAARIDNHDALLTQISEALAVRTRAEWTALLEPEKILTGSVRTYGEVVVDPQLASNNSLVDAEHLGRAIKLVRWPGRVFGQRYPRALEPAPAAGADSRLVLNDLDYDDAENEQLQAASVISLA